jgi:enediyne biosynthesis protein E4
MKKRYNKSFKLAAFSAIALAGDMVCAQTFSKVTTGAVVTTPGDSRSVNWVDVNNDGQPDLFISNGKAGGQDNLLYINQGGGAFEQVLDAPIVTDNKPSDGGTFADADNDGDLDAFVVNWYAEDNMYYVKNASNQFDQYLGVAMAASGGYSETASWGDYDNDGLVDLYVTRSGPTFATRKNQLYHNDGMNVFTKMLDGEHVNNALLSRSVNWTDMDNDGDLDLFVSSEGVSSSNEAIYRNDGNSIFTRIISGAIVNNGGSTMSSSWGDYDNDGDLDVYLCNDGSNNALFRNDGNMNFTKITGDPVVMTNSHSFSSAWSDIDNDGDIDLFVTNAFNTVAVPLNNFLFSNNGNGTFTKIEGGFPATDLSWSYGCAFGDYDNDGFEDLAVATTTFSGVDQPDLLYHNDGNANNWITVRLVGTLANKSAIGTKIYLTATINGVPVTQMREISAQSQYCGQNDLRAHFGLGNATAITSITVDWPSATPNEIFTGVSTNQFIAITEGIGLSVGSFDGDTNFRIYPNPTQNTLNIQSKNRVVAQSASVYNTLGQLLMTVTDWQQGVDVSQLQAGHYFIRVYTDRGNAVTRFIKI